MNAKELYGFWGLPNGFEQAGLSKKLFF